MDYYGKTVDYIHLKFGDMLKNYNFTDEFRAKHPKFCEEYEKYWEQKPGKFENPLQIVNYVQYWDIPVHFYFNYTDTPAKNIQEVQQYLVREVMPRDYGDFVENKFVGWDGEQENDTELPIVVIVDGKTRTFMSMKDLLAHANEVSTIMKDV